MTQKSILGKRQKHDTRKKAFWFKLAFTQNTHKNMHSTFIHSNRNSAAFKTTQTQKFVH